MQAGNQAIKILHLEDYPDDAVLVQRALAGDGLAVEIHCMSTPAEYEAALRATAEHGHLHLILADYALPAFAGVDALALAQEWCPAVPFIFVTGQLGEERAIETLKRGATDYVLKSHLERLGPAVRRALREADERARRERAEAMAVAEREWLRVTLASIGDAVIATDMTGHVTFMNQVAEAVSGWPQAEAVGQPIERVFHIVNEETRALVESPVVRVLRDGAVVGLANHTVLLRRDGGQTAIDDSGAPIRDDQDRLVGVVLVFRDITERREAEAGRQASDQRFRTLVLATAAVVWTTDGQGQFVAPQESWAAYTGQPWEAHRGMGWLEMIHPDDRAAVAAQWAAAVAAKKPYEGHGRLWNAKDREYCHYEVRAAPLFNRDGSVREWIGTIMDVNERELARAAARESEGRFRIMADTAPVLIWMADPDGRLAYFNRTWLEFTGRGLEQELGDGWAAGIHADDFDRCVAVYQEAVRTHQHFQQEYRLRRHDGAYRWMLDTGVPRFEQDGRFAGLVGSCIDIHERRAADKALRTRARQQAAVADLGQRALAGLELPALLDRAAQLVTDTLEVEFCKILELLPGGQALRLAAGVGWRPGLVGQYVAGAGRESQAGFTLMSDEPVVVADLTRETRFSGPPLLVEHGVMSGVSVIIRGPGEAWGVLGAHTGQQRNFGADDIAFLQSVANVLAEAITRAQAEAALRVSRDQIVAILQGVAEGVTVQERRGALVYANDAAARLVGYPSAQALVAASQGEIMGKFAVFDEQGRLFPLDQLPGRRALLGEPDVNTLLRYRILATGEELWSQVHARAIFDAAGRVQMAVSIFHDVTDLKRAELTQRLLADAGELLAADMNPESLLEGLARLAVPQTVVPGSSTVVPGSGTGMVTPGSGTGAGSEVPGFSTVVPGSGTGMVTPGSGTGVVTPGSGTGMVTPGSGMVTPGSGTGVVTPGSGMVTPGSGTGAGAGAGTGLADYCLVYQVEPDGQVRSASYVHADPAQSDLLRAYVEARRTVPDETARQVSEALLRQEPLLLSHLDRAAIMNKLPPEQQHVAPFVPHSVILAPLVARGRIQGVLAFARTVTAQPYQDSDLAVAQELARRAALAVDNSRLYAEAQNLNAELEARVQMRTEELNVTLEQLRAANAGLEVEIAERQAAEDKFRKLLQAAPDATIIVDAQGKVVLANSGAETLFGYTAGELVGQPVERLLPRRQYVLHPQARPMGQGLELFGRHRDGREFPVEISLSPLQTPDGLLVTSAIRDISDRQRADELLRQSERQLAQAQQIAQVGSWRWDIAADTFTGSEVLHRIYGFDRQSFPGNYAGFVEHVHPDDREAWRAITAAARRAGLPFEHEHRIVRADGQVRHIYSRGEVLRDADGQAVAITGISQDITDRKHIEKELRASQEQLRQLSSYLQAAREEERARISREIHDELGGALTGLKMEVARLAKKPDGLTQAELQTRSRSMSALIDGTVQTVRRIATDLRPGILDDFGLAAAIEWQLQEFGARAGLEYDYQSTVDQIELDPNSSTALFRLFQETLTNVARHAQATRVTARLEATPTDLILEVRDNGRGITPAEIDNAQSLGLLGMRERVHLLAGDLSISGAPGQGTTVLIKVPLNPWRAGATDGPAAP